MGRCVEAYPYLATLAEVADPNVRAGHGLLVVRQHALELHRSLILEDLRDIQKDEGRIDEDIQRVRRSRVQVKLQRLRPGWRQQHHCCAPVCGWFSGCRGQGYRSRTSSALAPDLPTEAVRP